MKNFSRRAAEGTEKRRNAKKGINVPERLPSINIFFRLPPLSLLLCVKFLFFSYCIFIVSSCTTFVDIKGRQKGSVDNPVLCDRPEGEREYLKRLRSPEGDPVSYEWLDAVLGPQGHVLDRFRILNPARKNDTRSIGTKFLDLFREEPKLPPAFRIYMDMYRAGQRDKEAVPGFILLEEDK